MLVLGVTLKARAWGPSMPPSATATADFMPGVSAPTITPGDGTYTMAQFVLLGVATSGAEIRFTLDGTDPNEGSALYAGPLEVATATVLKARGYKAGFAPSVVTTATFTFDYGTLATPTAYPPAGSYLAAQSVTLSGPPGGTVRYTLDGTEPTALSPAYTAPVTVASTLVLKARAFLTDWAPSATLVAAYTIGAEAVPPSIQVSVLPPANAAGWHHAPVRLVYACSDVGSWVATCPPEAVVATDGAGQTVTAVATDAAGNEATASVTLSIDRTAPVVQMTAPANGQTVTGTDVTVSGTVADALSGLASAQCNGVPAAVVAGTITCTVAVRPGTNAVVLQASDVAGNSASVGVRVLVPSTPTSVAIVPAQPTLGVGQTREVRLVDQAGLPVSGATWAVSEATILSVTDTDGVLSVEALAVGTATVSATWNGLTADTVVTVAALTAEGGITPGTKLWTLPLLDPMASRQLFFANRVEAEGPDLFFLETAASGATLRGVRADGTPLSAWPVPPEATMVLADRDGGVVLSAAADCWWNDRGLLRVPGVETDPVWRYTSEGSVMFVAGQAPDGTIYVNEMTLDEWATTTLVGLDGRTGQVKFRVGSAGRRQYRQINGNSNVIVEPMSLVAVGFDGAAYLTTGSEDSLDGPGNEGHYHREKQLMRVASDGTTTTTIVDSEDLAVSWSDLGNWWDRFGGGVPDPRGGMHVEWRITTSTSSGFVDTYRHAYVGPEGAGPVVEGRLPFWRVGDALTGYDDAGNAYDMTTGALKYSAPAGSSFIAPLAGGGAAYRVSTGSPADAAGAVDGTALFADAPMGTLETEGTELRAGGAPAGTAAVAEAGATALGGDLVEVDAAGLVTRTSSLAGVPDDAVYFDGQWIGGIGEDGYGGTVLANGEEAFPDGNQTPQAVTKAPWGVRLLGDAATRTKLLWFFQDALKQDPNMEPSAPSRLFVDGNGFLRISGDIGQFKGLVPPQSPPAVQWPPSDIPPPPAKPPTLPFPTGTSIANDIGNLVVRGERPVIEVGLTQASLYKAGGAYTFDRGIVTGPELEGSPVRQESGYGAGGPQILMNLGQLALSNATMTARGFGTFSYSRFAGQKESTEWTVKDFVWDLNDSQGTHPPLVLWHELGHAWGASNGRSISAGDTWGEAVGWENLVRFKRYGAFGPTNAPRIKH